MTPSELLDRLDCVMQLGGYLTVYHCSTGTSKLGDDERWLFTALGDDYAVTATIMFTIEPRGSSVRSVSYSRCACKHTSALRALMRGAIDILEKETP